MRKYHILYYCSGKFDHYRREFMGNNSLSCKQLQCSRERNAKCASACSSFSAMNQPESELYSTTRKITHQKNFIEE